MRKLLLFIPIIASFVFCSALNPILADESIPPLLILRVEPSCPSVAIEKNLEGSVFLELIIDRHGHVIDAKVIKSDNPIFNNPSLIAVKKWRYRIDKFDKKKNVRIYKNVTIRFSLTP